MPITECQSLEDLTDSVPGVVYQFLVDPDGNWSFPFVSKGVEVLFEVAREDAYRDADALTQCIIDEDRESHRSSVKHAVTNFLPWHHEHRIRTVNGNLKWIRGSALPRRRADGSVLWNGILTDISELMELKQAYARQNEDLEQKIESLLATESGLQVYKSHLQDMVTERTEQLSNTLTSLEQSEQFKRAIINSLPANIAVINQDGIILSVNEQWKQFSTAGHAMDHTSMDIGASYLEACKKAIPVKSKLDNSARKAFTGIMSVLKGRRTSFSMDYPCHAPDRKQWFQMTVTKLSHNLKGAVISHVDITDLKIAEEERRDFTRHLVDAIEKERIRIARELHDEIGQSLTLLSFDVVRTRQEAPPQSENILHTLSGMNDSLQGMVTTVQRICTNLRPALLDDLGLAAAIEWKCEDFSRRSGISCTVAWKGVACGNPRCATELFRIVQESLNNIGKYAHASNVHINFTKNSRFNKLEIRDDGCGFKTDQTLLRNGFGIMGMRERALSLGATFSIKSEVNKGTVITVIIPCGKKEFCCEDPHY